jgi:hypothetical protein
MRSCVVTLAGLGLLTAVLATPAFAQTAGSGPSCLFPLACPGAAPPKPEPLLGPPEDQTAAMPAESAPKPVHHRKKHVAKKAK